MKLFSYEIRKIWQSRFFLICLAIALCINVFLLWVDSDKQSSDFTSSAYKAVQTDLKGLSTEEQQDFISQKRDTIYALLQIDYFLKSGIQLPGDQRQQYYDYITEYGDLYFSQEYNLYTTDLNQEFQFLSSIQAELNLVASYEEYLEDIQNRSQSLSDISIFQDSYAAKNIENTASAYANLNNISIEYAPQKGFYTAINYLYTDIILIFSMLVVAGISIREERDSGMIHFIRSMPHGRRTTAFGKILALSVSTLAVLLLLYGTNILFCQLTYGLGSLSRSVQSIPFLMRCTLPISAGQYLLLFLLAKWAAAVVVGLWIATALLWARHAVWGWVLSLGFIFLQWGLNQFIPATGKANVLKYGNMAGILDTNTLLGTYQNLYWFGRPVSAHLVAAIFAAFSTFVLLVVFTLLISRSHLNDAKIRTVVSTHRRRTTTLLHEEGYKILIINGSFFLLLAFLFFQVYQGVTAESFVQADDIYYRYYMENLAGPYTQDKYDFLVQEYESFAPVRDLNDALAQGTITETEYSMQIAQYYSLQQRMIVFNSVVQQARWMSTSGAHFVYDTGYKILFDFNSQTDLNETVLTTLLCSLCFSGIFAFERQTGMDPIIRSTPQGANVTFKAKARIAVWISLFITLIASIAKYLHVVIFFGLPGLFSPARSISAFSHLPKAFPILGVILVSIFARFISCLFLAVVIMALSQKTGNIIATFFLATLSFSLMPLLSILGIYSASKLSIYPLFHIAYYMTRIGLFPVILVLLLLAVITGACYKFFMMDYTA